MFIISVEEDWDVIGRAVRLAIYRQPHMVNAGWGDVPKGASPSLGRRHKLRFHLFIAFFVLLDVSLQGNWGFK